MNPAKNDLSVRQHTRYDCDIASRATLDESDAASVRLSPEMVVAADTLSVRVIDTGRGGLGLSSLVYLPPGTCLSVALEINGSSQELLVRVQRVRMTDRKPTYYIGTSFNSSSSDQAGLVEALMAQFARAEGERHA